MELVLGFILMYYGSFFVPEIRPEGSFVTIQDTECAGTVVDFRDDKYLIELNNCNGGAGYFSESELISRKAL